MQSKEELEQDAIDFLNRPFECNTDLNRIYTDSYSLSVFIRICDIIFLKYDRHKYKAEENESNEKNKGGNKKEIFELNPPDLTVYQGQFPDYYGYDKFARIENYIIILYFLTFELDQKIKYFLSVKQIKKIENTPICILNFYFTLKSIEHHLKNYKRDTKTYGNLIFKKNPDLYSHETIIFYIDIYVKTEQENTEIEFPYFNDTQRLNFFQNFQKLVNLKQLKTNIATKKTNISKENAFLQQIKENNDNELIKYNDKNTTVAEAKILVHKKIQALQSKLEEYEAEEKLYTEHSKTFLESIRKLGIIFYANEDYKVYWLPYVTINRESPEFDINLLINNFFDQSEDQGWHDYDPNYEKGVINVPVVTKPIVLDEEEEDDETYNQARRDPRINQVIDSESISKNEVQFVDDQSLNILVDEQEEEELLGAFGGGGEVVSKKQKTGGFKNWGEYINSI